ncbi:MAG: hypothetical protein AAFV53_30395 [Myxococcota bacterium]
MRADVEKRLSPEEKENARRLLLAQTEEVKRIAGAMTRCLHCHGARCEKCQWTGVDLERADPRWASVVLKAIESTRKLAGVEGPAEVIRIVESEDPTVLIDAILNAQKTIIDVTPPLINEDER